MATKKKSAPSKRSSSNASDEIRKEMRAAKAGKRVNAKQAIAIGLSKARRSGKDIPAPKPGSASPATRKKAQQDIAAGRKSTGAAKKTASKKTAAKKSTAKKTSAKKTASKKAAVKKSSTKKTSAKKTAKKATAKRR